MYVTFMINVNNQHTIISHSHMGWFNL